MSWPRRIFLWVTRRLYNEFAWAYDLASWIVSLGQWSRWRRAALDHVRGERVLEIGFGTGELLAEMAMRGWRVCGLDPSPAMQRVAARKLRRRRARAPRLRGRAEALPFLEGTFDTVVSTFPAECILSRKTFEEAARLLAPGGRFVIAGVYYQIGRVRRRCVGQIPPRQGHADLLARIGMLSASSGFELRVLHQTIAWRAWQATMPLLILERLPAKSSSVD